MLQSQYQYHKSHQDCQSDHCHKKRASQSIMRRMCMHMWEPIVKKQYLVPEQQWLWLTEIWETHQTGWHRASELVWEQFQIFQVAQESQLSWDCPSQIIIPEVQPLCNEENVHTYMRTHSEETVYIVVTVTYSDLGDSPNWSAQSQWVGLRSDQTRSKDAM